MKIEPTTFDPSINSGQALRLVEGERHSLIDLICGKPTRFENDSRPGLVLCKRSVRSRKSYDESSAVAKFARHVYAAFMGVDNRFADRQAKARFGLRLMLPVEATYFFP
jgi:hypothetical protein